MNTAAAGHTPPGKISYQELLDSDMPALNRIFRRYLEYAVNGSSHLNREESQEMLFLMEEAPELKEKIKQVKLDIHKGLEKKISALENILDERQDKKNELNRRMLKLKNQHQQAMAQKEKKEKQLTQTLQKLEQTRKQQKKAETSDKKQWIQQEKQWNQKIKVTEKNHEKAKKQWEFNKQELLKQCRTFPRENPGG